MPGSSGSRSCRAARFLPLSLLWACSLSQYRQYAPAAENAFECSKQTLLDLGYKITSDDPHAGIVRATKSLGSIQDFLIISLKSSGGVLQLHVGAGSGSHIRTGNVDDPDIGGHYLAPTGGVRVDADSIIARCSAASERGTEEIGKVRSDVGQLSAGL
jgi:hypothetical protein